MWRVDALRAAHGFAEFADGSNSENASLISVASRGVVFGKDALFRYRVYATSCGLSPPSGSPFRRSSSGGMSRWMVPCTTPSQRSLPHSGKGSRPE